MKVTEELKKKRKEIRKASSPKKKRINAFREQNVELIKVNLSAT